MTNKTLCYYITGHGYGHAIRTLEILKALPSDVRILVKTTAPARLFHEGLASRDLQVIAAEYDCGSVQKDNLTVLPRETLVRYWEIRTSNQKFFADEVTFLQDESVTCVVSDIASFPLRVAQAAGVPGVAVANFTWTDIYSEYAETADDTQLLNEMRSEYATASVALVTPLSMPTVPDAFRNVERVPLVARRGNKIGHELRRKHGLPVGIHLALPYLGAWGLNIDWTAVGRLRDWVFLTYDTPLDVVENVIVLDREMWPYADVAASVDTVLAKPGYGTVTECIASSVPLVYVPRRHFAEQDALIAGIQRWGGGVALDEADFLAGRWGPALQGALECRPDVNVFATNGAQVIARKLDDRCTAAF